ncbi:MAG: flavin reductase family protein, partial [Akkermansia sp.]
MQEIDFESIQDNPARLIGKQWMMITAGTLGADGESSTCNTMTASWGGLGYMWNRPVAYVFVRPNRHTAPLIDANESFTLSFMPEQYRKA